MTSIPSRVCDPHDKAAKVARCTIIKGKCYTMNNSKLISTFNESKRGEYSGSYMVM
ncbi:MAG: hypothetical protein WA364_26265 [Candidatus Nitrosopolaris sp.]